MFPVHFTRYAASQEPSLPSLPFRPAPLRVMPRRATSEGRAPRAAAVASSQRIGAIAQSEGRSGSDSDSDADSDWLDAISAAARDAYPNARSGWAPSARHQAMLQRMGERQNNRRDLELHRGCRGQEKTNKQQRHQHNDPASIPGIDLSAGRAAFDPSYNHACPISIYKSRRERNSRYGFRFN